MPEGSYIEGADTTLLYKKTLNTLAPVLALTCADAFGKFNAKKSANASPMECVEEQDEVLTCAKETIKFVEKEHKLEVSKYQACLDANPRNFAKCAELRDALCKTVLRNYDKIQFNVENELTGGLAADLRDGKNVL